MEKGDKRGPFISDMAYVLGLFIVTRAVLAAAGIIVHSAWLQQPLQSGVDLTNIWNVWDGRLYVDVARDGYSAQPLNDMGMANYAFFPLYPLLMRLGAAVVGDYALAGIIVSNVCLIVACYYLYRYVGLDEGAGRATATRSAKYLLLFPMAFLFSAVLSEALFVALAIACLYYARRGRWLIAGLVGFFLPLARLPGLAIAVPLAYEYLRQHGVSSAQPPDLRRLLKPELLTLLLPPLGLGLWMAFNYGLTGDPLGFIHIQATWGGKFALPPVELLARLDPAHGYVFTGAIVTLGALALLLIFHRKVDFGGWMFGILLIGIPLFSEHSGFSMLRYLAVVFPLSIIAAKVTEDRRVDDVLTVVCFVLQVVLMALWTTWSPLIV